MKGRLLRLLAVYAGAVAFLLALLLTLLVAFSALSLVAACVLLLTVCAVSAL